jgi:hypothetical protein
MCLRPKKNSNKLSKTRGKRKELTQEQIDDLVRTFHHRVQKMIDRKGDDTQVKACLAPSPENSGI